MVKEDVRRLPSLQLVATLHASCHFTSTTISTYNLLWQEANLNITPLQ
jgi:hypothetical protein